MDQEQEVLQFLGFIAIAETTTRSMFQWKKTLIFPLFVIFLASTQTSNFFFLSFMHQDDFHNLRPMNSGGITKTPSTSIFYDLSYFVFLLTLSLISTSSLVYNIATFKCFSSVNLMDGFALVFVLNTLTGVFFLLGIALNGLTNAGFLFTFVSLVIYMAGFIYLVVENLSGVNETAKSKVIRIKGKIGISVLMSVVLLVVFVAIKILLGFALKLQFMVGVWVVCALVAVFGLLVKTLMDTVRKLCSSRGHKCQVGDASSLVQVHALDV